MLSFIHMNPKWFMTEILQQSCQYWQQTLRCLTKALIVIASLRAAISAHPCLSFSPLSLDGALEAATAADR